MTLAEARPPGLSPGRGATSSLSLEELARQAGVQADHARRLIDLGVLEEETRPEPYGAADVRRVKLARSWETAGLPIREVMDLVRAGSVSMSWLDVPVITPAERLELTYEQLCTKEDVPFALMQALEEALGFEPPAPHDRPWGSDRELIGLVRSFLAAGASPTPALRLVRVYADSLRRVAKAEAELYESEIENPLDDPEGAEHQAGDGGVQFSERAIAASLERALLDIYRRYREHVWIEHCLTCAEVALERAGVRQRVRRPPAICFVDLTGYTRITEERGDELAAQLAANLGSLVEDISRHHGGRPIRWLGDGGMFHFKEPQAAILSGLDMVESAPEAGLPPVHIGIHTGPVVFQDGDVYGRTVNLASRIASHARGGQVLASDETVDRCLDTGVRFERVGPVSLKGLTRPMMLHRAVRDSA